MVMKMNERKYLTHNIWSLVDPEKDIIDIREIKPECLTEFKTHGFGVFKIALTLIKDSDKNYLRLYWYNPKENIIYTGGVEDIGPTRARITLDPLYIEKIDNDKIKLITTNINEIIQIYNEWEKWKKWIKHIKREETMKKIRELKEKIPYRRLLKSSDKVEVILFTEISTTHDGTRIFPFFTMRIVNKNTGRWIDLNPTRYYRNGRRQRKRFIEDMKFLGIDEKDALEILDAIAEHITYTKAQINTP